MGAIVFSMGASLDGFIEDREGSIGFGNPSVELHQYSNDVARETEIYLLGKDLYEMMEPYWPDVVKNPTGDEVTDEFGRIWVQSRRIVFSRTLEEVGPGCELQREIDPDEIRRLKADTSGMIGVGGAVLASDLAELELVDEVEILVKPVALGGGKPMFGKGFDGRRFELLRSRAFDSGELVLTYRLIKKA